MFAILIVSFLAGIFTVLSPCVLPILPFVLGASLDGKRTNSLPLIVGLVFSFAVFTLFGGFVVTSLGLSSHLLRVFSAILLTIFALFLIWPKLDALLERALGRVSRIGQGHSSGKGFIAGTALGLVWAPCAGPVLGTVSTLIATQGATLRVLFPLSAFCIGVGVPLIIFARFGAALGKASSLARYMPYARKSFGVICLGMALLIADNRETKFTGDLTDALPSSFSSKLKTVEEKLADKTDLKNLNVKTADEQSKHISRAPTQIRLPTILPDGVLRIDSREFGTAPEFATDVPWINSKPLRLSELRGKVVLVNFWTFGCINCIHTLPYVKGWFEKYKSAGLVVIGVHTPELAMERDESNLREAIRRLDIHYPVVVDNAYRIWKSYRNSYWPAQYLVDANGTIRYSHFGEGKYDTSEEMIQKLIQERKSADPKI